MLFGGMNHKNYLPSCPLVRTAKESRLMSDGYMRFLPLFLSGYFLQIYTFFLIIATVFVKFR